MHMQNQGPVTGGFASIELRPVGVVRSDIKDAAWAGSAGDLDWIGRMRRLKADQETVAELIINSNLEDALEGIEDFSHLLVLYWPHLLPSEKRSVFKVHPTGRQDFPLVGVFATRSPARPNMVLISVVRLLERRGNILRVTGLDAIDGSPLIDIKPHIPDEYEAGEVSMPAWMAEIRQTFSDNS